MNWSRNLPVKLYDVLKKAKRKLGITTPFGARLQELLGGREDFSFLQLGANDGISLDPYREFILASRGVGVLVEPLPWLAAQLRQNYRHRKNLFFETLAVAYDGQNLILHVPESEERSAVASLDREHLSRHGVAGMRELEVPATTVEALLEKYGLSSVDCLFLDVEGAEAQILLGMDYRRAGAWLIAFEIAHLGDLHEAVAAKLRANGYRVEEFGMDAIAWKPFADA